MAELKIDKNLEFTREDLLCLGIYDLRELGRDVGVCSPTTLKKENLVDAILAVIYGEAPKRRIGKGRGRPTRRADRPSRLFLDLVDKSSAPKCDTSFIFGDNPKNNPYQETLISARVASTSVAYEDDEARNNPYTAKKGIVSIEDDGVYVRKFKYMPSEYDMLIPVELVGKYKLDDNDVIEYFISSDNKVGGIVSINGVLFNNVDQEFKRFIKKEPETIVVEDKQIITGRSNVVYTLSMDDRRELTDKICEELNEKDYSIVKVCFDRVSPTGASIYKKGMIELYTNVIGDEHETIALMEQGIEKAKVLDRAGDNVVLVVDNLGWLVSVASSFPKALYGTFIQKMGALPNNPNTNLTIVCVSGKLQEDTRDYLAGIFANIVE